VQKSPAIKKRALKMNGRRISNDTVCIFCSFCGRPAVYWEQQVVESPRSSFDFSPFREFVPGIKTAYCKKHYAEKIKP
jgi:hypothetical protein